MDWNETGDWIFTDEAHEWMKEGWSPTSPNMDRAHMLSGRYNFQVAGYQALDNTHREIQPEEQDIAQPREVFRHSMFSIRHDPCIEAGNPLGCSHERSPASDISMGDSYEYRTAEVHAAVWRYERDNWRIPDRENKAFRCSELEYAHRLNSQDLVHPGPDSDQVREVLDKQYEITQKFREDSSGEMVDTVCQLGIVL